MVVSLKWTAYKAKQIAQKLLHGLTFDHNLKLGGYIEELNSSNQSSTSIVQTDPEIIQNISVF